jgi:hypothetical protein
MISIKLQTPNKTAMNERGGPASLEVVGSSPVPGRRHIGSSRGVSGQQACSDAEGQSRKRSPAHSLGEMYHVKRDGNVSDRNVV